jgi:hypothetical protein
VVVVVPSGVKQAVLSSTARRLRNQGAEPSWAIFLPSPGSKKAGDNQRQAWPLVRHGDL